MNTLHVKNYLLEQHIPWLFEGSVLAVCDRCLCDVIDKLGVVQSDVLLMQMYAEISL